MGNSNGLPKDTIRLANELNQVLHCIGNKNVVGQVNYKSAMKYARKVIQWVNEEEAKSEKQNYTSKRGKRGIIK